MFFDIPSNSVPIAVRNSLTNQFFQKNLIFCIFSKKKKNYQVFIWISILVIPDHKQDFQSIGPMGRCFLLVEMSVCLSVCLSVRLFTFELPFKLLLPPLPEVGCPMFLEIRNPWGKVMERSGLTFEHFSLKVARAVLQTAS